KTIKREGAAVAHLWKNLVFAVSAVVILLLVLVGALFPKVFGHSPWPSVCLFLCWLWDPPCSSWSPSPSPWAITSRILLPTACDSRLSGAARGSGTGPFFTGPGPLPGPLMSELSSRGYPGAGPFGNLCSG